MSAWTVLRAAATLGIKALSMGLGLYAMTLVAQRLAPATLGVASAVLAVASQVALLASLATDQALVRSFSGRVGPAARAFANAVFRQRLAWLGGAGLVTAALAALWLEPAEGWMVPMGLVLVVAERNTGAWVLQAQERQVRLQGLMLGVSALFVALYSLLLPGDAAWKYVAVRVIGTLAIFWLTWRSTGLRPWARGEPADLGGAPFFEWRLYFGAVLLYALTTGNITVLALTADAREVGLYQLAFVYAGAVYTLGEASLSVLYPRQLRWRAAGADLLRRRTLGLMAALLALFGAAFAALWAWGREPYAAFVGEAYAGSFDAFAVQTAGRLLGIVTIACTGLLLALRRDTALLLAVAAGAAVGLGAAFWLCPGGGALGASWANLAGQAVYLALLVAATLVPGAADGATFAPPLPAEQPPPLAEAP